MKLPKKNSSIKDWLLYICKIHHKEIDLGLSRIRIVAKKLKLDLSRYFVITIGGTNGKGTTCKVLETIFINSNIKVGVYTSPHILKYNERIRIQGKELSDDYHVESMYAIEKARNHITLSYFEFSTLAALYIFNNINIDVIILEVGMGGRLDATNIVDANISVITSIALDHTEFLGSNISSIAKEKAGIFRPGKIAVIGEKNIPKIINKIAKKENVSLYLYGKDWWWNKLSTHWCWWNKYNKFTNLPLPAIPLQNAATALATINYVPFNISNESINIGLKSSFLPGRFQYIKNIPIQILDVGHNPHAAKYLSNKLKEIHYAGKLRVVVAMMLNKDIKNTLLKLYKQADIWYLASLNECNGASSNYLSKFLKEKNKKIYDNVKDAWNQALKDAHSQDCILAFGSFKTISRIMKIENILI